MRRLDLKKNLLPALLLVLLTGLILCPLISIFAKAVIVDGHLDLSRGWKTIAAAENRQTVGNSLLLGLCVVLCSTVIAVPTAYLLARTPRPAQYPGGLHLHQPGVRAGQRVSGHGHGRAVCADHHHGPSRFQPSDRPSKEQITNRRQALTKVCRRFVDRESYQRGSSRTAVAGPTHRISGMGVSLRPPP